jgi:hypothetical protein
MCRKTKQQPINLTIGTSITQFLPNNMARKAFIFGPVVQGPANQPAIVQVVFAAGTAQQWVVPNGVSQIVDAYVWGSGGNSVAGQAVNGGGGGGGGGFGTTGPLTVTPGTVFTLNVDAAGLGVGSSLVNPSGTTLVAVGSGANGAASAGGAAGTATTGVIKFAGGAGATASTTKGGGGGGSGGNGSAGGAGNATGTGGTAGGVNVINGQGQGAVGGVGNSANLPGGAGNKPGSGGGGGGATTGAAANGADGVAVIFYALPSSSQILSISRREDVVAGAGTLNWIGGQPWVEVITDNDIGSSVRDPWYAVANIAGVVCQVTEYSYDDDPDQLIADLAGLRY